MVRKHLPFLVLICFAATSAHAIPGLQIYIDGATYIDGDETWVTESTEFDLWVIGDGSHPGVKLTASFFGMSGSMTLTPTTTSRITDPSTPPAPTFFGTGTGGHPVLPNHGIFNDANLHHWDDLLLGDFTLTDSPIGDYDGSQPFPTTFPNQGQVNVYHVQVTGWTGVHFDAYSTDGTKTPGSHDGEYLFVVLGVESSTWGAVKAIYQH